MDREFEGRKILVIGASSGIGRACAIQLGAQGAGVILVGRNKERLEETAGHIPQGRSAILPCDVSDFEAARIGVKDAAVLLGDKRLNGCVFSAGSTRVCSVKEVREQALLEMYRTNLFSLYGIMSSFASRRVSEEGAAFVSISSWAALRPEKGQAIYAGTKAAMNALTSVAAQELAKRRVRVNAVCPEMVDTPMGHDGLCLLSEERRQKRFPLGMLTADDIADTVLYLLSDASKKITGQAISISAGSTGGDDRVGF